MALFPTSLTELRKTIGNPFAEKNEAGSKAAGAQLAAEVESSFSKEDVVKFEPTTALGNYKAYCEEYDIKPKDVKKTLSKSTTAHAQGQDSLSDLGICNEPGFANVAKGLRETINQASCRNNADRQLLLEASMLHPEKVLELLETCEISELNYGQLEELINQPEETKSVSCLDPKDLALARSIGDAFRSYGVRDNEYGSASAGDAFMVSPTQQVKDAKNAVFEALLKGQSGESTDV